MTDAKPRLDTSYQVALWRAGCFELAHLIHLADEVCPTNPGISFEQLPGLHASRGRHRQRMDWSRGRRVPRHVRAYR